MMGPKGWFRTAHGQKSHKIQGYDKENLRPVIRSSICNGEQVAGFRDKRTGQFTEVMLLRNRNDLELFLSEYDVAEEEIKKEW